MRKVVAVLASSLLLFLLPLTVSAYGGYIAVRGEKVYHCYAECDELYKEKISDLLWYDTQKQAEASGKNLCEECGDYPVDWEDDEYELGAFTFFIPQNKLMNAVLEAETEYGWETGYQVCYEDMNGESEWAYDEGWSEGYKQGAKDAFNENSRVYNFAKIGEYEKRIEEARESGQISGAGYMLAAWVAVSFYKYSRKSN